VPPPDTPRPPGGSAPHRGARLWWTILLVGLGAAGLLVLTIVVFTGGDSTTAPTTTTRSTTALPTTTPSTSARPTSAQPTTPTAATTTPTSPTLVRTGAAVVVANGSGQAGAGAALAGALTTRGYDIAGATDTSSQQTTLGFVMVAPNDSAARTVGASLLRDLGMPSKSLVPLVDPPVAVDALGSATVLVVIGATYPGRPLVPTDLLDAIPEGAEVLFLPEPATFDPADPAFVLDPLTRLFYGALFYANLEPDLAERAIANTDRTEWELTLKPGRLFHDGTPVDAGAVIANLRHQVEGRGSELVQLTAFEAADDRTVELRFASPTDLPALFSGPIGALASPAALDAGTLARLPVGAGPLRFTSWTPGVMILATSYTVVGIDDWAILFTA